MSVPSSSAPSDPPSDEAAGVTELLSAWGSGSRGALDALLPIVYAELRRQADRALRREAAGHTLEPTALVHEAYLRLVGQARAPARSRAEFHAIAARVMRQVLVDHARARQAAKRGAGAAVTLTDTDAVVGEPTAEVLAVHEALERLSALDPDQARLIELRYFAGLTIDEAATALGVSPATAKREWVVARAWLRRELSP